MHVKRKMELTRKQKDQLNQFRDSVTFVKLQEKCEAVEKELESLITDRTDIENKRKGLIERLTSIQQDLKNAREEEYIWQKRLEAANKSAAEDLQSICLALGYQVSNHELLENNGIQLTLHYRDICYVTYSEVAQIFDLIEIFPQHPNFPQIKEFLKNSQDLRGLLSCLRKYFDFTLECRENQEQQ